MGAALVPGPTLPQRLPAAGPGGEGTAPGEVTGGPVAPILPFLYFLDVEGWYAMTPYEAVVRSAVDLTAASSEEMARALPERVGAWQRAGPDQFLGDDPGIITYLGHPTVALQQSYLHPSGQRLDLVLVGNVGEDSFLLFSHTPVTCYPGRLWQVVEHRRMSVPVDDRAIHVQYLLTEQAESGRRQVTLFWYLWDDPRRDASEGVLSVRVNLFVSPGEPEGAAVDLALDFLRALFPVTVPWQRY